MYSLYMGHIDKYIIGAPCKIDPKDRMVLHSNKLLGAPRLRLLRVGNESCVIPKSFQDTIQVMFFMTFESQLKADCFPNAHRTSQIFKI